MIAMKTFDYESADRWLQDNWSSIKAKQVRECQKNWHELMKVKKAHSPGSRSEQTKNDLR